MKNRSGRCNWRGLLLANLGLCALYVLCGRAGLLMALPPGYASPLFVPAGIALAACTVGGAGLLPAVALGALALNLVFPTLSAQGVSAGARAGRRLRPRWAPRCRPGPAPSAAPPRRSGPGRRPRHRPLPAAGAAGGADLQQRGDGRHGPRRRAAASRAGARNGWPGGSATASASCSARR